MKENSHRYEEADSASSQEPNGLGHGLPEHSAVTLRRELPTCLQPALLAHQGSQIGFPQCPRSYFWPGDLAERGRGEQKGEGASEYGLGGPADHSK